MKYLVLRQTADTSYISNIFLPDTLWDISCRWTFTDIINLPEILWPTKLLFPITVYSWMPSLRSQWFSWIFHTATLCTFGFCGGHNFLLPLQEFTRCLGRISTTLSFSQHFCVAFLDTLSATCPIPSLMHGKTNSLAPPAALTPLTSLNTPLKNNCHTPKRQRIVMSQLSLACSVVLSPNCMDSWQKGQQAAKDGN